MSETTKTVLLLGAALVAGALVQRRVQTAASKLGLSRLELVLLAAAAGAVVRRVAPLPPPRHAPAPLA